MSSSSLQIPPVVDGAIKTEALTYYTFKDPLKVATMDLKLDPAAAKSGEIVTPKQLLIETKAASINPVDLCLKGLSSRFYKASVQKVMGGDFAGLVLKAGSETGFKAGDRVYGDIIKPFSSTGSFSKYLLFDPKDALFCNKIPEGMTYEQASSLCIASGTAFEALRTHKGSLKGANVLVLGGGTSLGSHAIQFAKHYFGAKHVAATCSSRSSERVKQFGPDKLIDYRKGKTSEINEILESVKEYGKFDIVVDSVRDPVLYGYLDSTLKTKEEGGIFTQIQGSKSVNYTNIAISDLLPQWQYIVESVKELVGLSKFQFYSLLETPDEEYGPAVEKLWKEKKFLVTLDSVHDFKTDYETAIQKVASASAQGKVVLKF